MTSRVDDGIVVTLEGAAVRTRERAAPRKVVPLSKSKTTKSYVSAAMFRGVVRRIEALERRVAGRETSKTRRGGKSSSLRWNIVQEDLLRRQIESKQALRRQ